MMKQYYVSYVYIDGCQGCMGVTENMVLSSPSVAKVVGRKGGQVKALTEEQVKRWRSPYVDYQDPSTNWYQLIQVLLDEGFVYCWYDGLGSDFLQRKTDASNLIVQVYGVEAIVTDGRAAVDHCFGRAGDIASIRAIIGNAELDQVMELVKLASS